MSNIDGYKCFHENFMTSQGIRLLPENIYTYNDSIRVKRSGFHFCLRLEDTLRYFNGLVDSVILCKVKALGNVEWYDDDYNEYYDICCTDKIYIDIPLSREEILSYVDCLVDFRFIRFIQGFKFTREELVYFRDKFSSDSKIQGYLSYYQEGDKEAFSRAYQRKKQYL